MSNPSKAKGTKWETDIVNLFHDNGFVGVERRALAGNSDRGDIAGLYVDGDAVVIEAKNEQRVDLAGWIAEVVAETANARARYGVVWAKRRGKTSPLDGYVVMTGDMFMQIIRDMEGFAR